VTTWSDPIQALTANDGFFDVIGTTYLNSIQPQNTLSAVTVNLTLLSTSSNVDLGADSPVVDTIGEDITTGLDTTVGSVITAISDGNGDFVMPERIKGGLYELKATHVTFGEAKFNIIIDKDSDINIVFDILWGNDFFTFDDLADVVF